jgi:hypothetical protein
VSACINTLHVGIHNRYSELPTEWTIRDSNPAGGKLFSPSLKRPDRPFGLQCFLFSGHRDAPYPEDKGPGHAVYHSLHLALISRMSGAISPFSLCAYMALVGENHFLTYNLSESNGRLSVSLPGQHSMDLLASSLPANTTHVPLNYNTARSDECSTDDTCIFVNCKWVDIRWQ